MKDKRLLAALVLCLLGILTACGKEGADNAAPQGQDSQPVQNEPGISQADQSGFLWQLEIRRAEATDSLANTQTVILYDGGMEDVQYQKTAGEGKLFLLLELSIQKNGTGGKAFSWSDVYVEDGEGSRYARHENDVFLEDYDLPRLKATDLTIGSNAGFVCFEIPADTDLSSLTLVHEAEEGRNVLEIPARQ